MILWGQLVQISLGNLLNIVSDYTPLVYHHNYSLFIAPFHDTIKDSFPDLIMLLKDNNENVQSAGICTIEKLAKHSM
jgi:hypothetical protein